MSAGDRYTSPLGDRRERAVLCRRFGCRATTWALDGLCDPCAELEHDVLDVEAPAQLELEAGPS